MAATPPDEIPQIAVPMLMSSVRQSVTWNEGRRTDGVKVVHLLVQSSHATMLVEVTLEAAAQLRDGLTEIITGGLTVASEMPRGPVGVVGPDGIIHA